MRARRVPKPIPPPDRARAALPEKRTFQAACAGARAIRVEPRAMNDHRSSLHIDDGMSFLFALPAKQGGIVMNTNDETINNNTVTVRNRDTMEQETIKLDNLVSYVEEKIKFLLGISYELRRRKKFIPRN